ncbi:MAG: tetratricopeptide repeat protein [Gammaproteobacteria bacterium]
MKLSHRILLPLVLVFATLPAHADFNDGIVAHQMGQYEKAYNIMRSLAEASNHAYAQYYVGMMYLNGQGVGQDYSRAGEWFLKAAENRVPQAQYKLARLYFDGRGLPRDYERAYAWFRVGAVHNHKLSINSLEEARSNLSDAELEEAEKLSLELIEKYGPAEGEEPGKPKTLKNQ